MTIRHTGALMTGADPLPSPTPTKSDRCFDIDQSVSATDRLAAVCTHRSSCLSIGLEPSPRYLPPGYEPTIKDYERFLSTLIEAGKDNVAAFKMNSAFFEALGTKGIDLMYRLREQLRGEYLIIDAKRGDIASSAQRYAHAMYEELGADATTVSPLMGRDSVDPFLEYTDRLTFVLCLTSNPGADDFLLPNDLFLHIAMQAAAWNTSHNAGLVVGATRPDDARRIRDAAPTLPMLIPGIGAQGGALVETAHATHMVGPFPGTLFHVTRGVLPDKDTVGDAVEVIRRKINGWNEQINQCLSWKETNQ